MPNIYFDIDGTIRGGWSREPEYSVASLSEIVDLDELGIILNPIKGQLYPLAENLGETRNLNSLEKFFIKKMHSRSRRQLRPGVHESMATLKQDGNILGILTGRLKDVLQIETISDLKKDGIVDEYINEKDVIMRPNNYEFKYGSGLSKLHFVQSISSKSDDKIFLIENDPKVSLIVQVGAKYLGLENVQVVVLNTKSTESLKIQAILTNNNIKQFNNFGQLPEVLTS